MSKYDWLDDFLQDMTGCVRDYKPEWGWLRYRVGEKMFAAVCRPDEKYRDYGGHELLTLKCEPMLGELMRAEYPDIVPGFYMDKRNWISVNLDGDVPDDVLRDLCIRSYELVFGKLTKKLQRELAAATPVRKIHIDGIPAAVYGEKSDKVWLFIHGKCGCKEEGEAFGKIVCPKGCQVLAIDLPEHGERKDEPGFDPWHAVPRLQAVMTYARSRWSSVSLRANSIGAWFSMEAMTDTPPEKALFVSPMLDMEKLIRNMMLWASVSENQLKQEGEIITEFGETLSWDYLQYTVSHPITRWDAPTEILYAGGDNLTDRETVEGFAARFGCGLTVMEDGEHWFHTPPQLEVLSSWEEAHS